MELKIMNKYILEKSKDLPGWWVFTDIENLVVVKFEDGKFNETQQVSFLDDDAAQLGASRLARIMREIGDYIVRYHSDIAFSRPYGLIYDIEDNLYMYCRKAPVWRIKVPDGTNLHALAASLSKAAEWLRKLA